MKARERMLAVLEGKKPDKIPFCIFTDLIPRGYFERIIRNSGLGLLTHVGPMVDEPLPVSEMPNVATTQRKSKLGMEIIYNTPVGDVSYEIRAGSMRTSSLDWVVPSTSLIKDVKDYEPLIYLINDTVFHVNLKEFKLLVDDLGEDGIIHVLAGLAPYVEAQYMLGLESWSYEQYDHPKEFARLLEALEKRNERAMKILVDIEDYKMAYLGDISDNLSPSHYIKHAIPFFKKYSKLFRYKGIKCGIHAHAKLLKRQKEVLAKISPDFIESYTPPPYGDLPLPELRKAVGEEVVILINYPETVFYKGYDETKKHIIELLKSDPSYRKMISFTEMGMMGVNSKYVRRIFEEGFRAVIDAINEVPY